MPLTTKQQRFVHEYLSDPKLNATEAYKRAGYKASDSSATKAASRLLVNVDIRAEIARVEAERCKKLDITAENVLKELALIGFANMQDYMRATPGGDPYLDFSALTREQSAALQEVTVEDYVDGRGEDARQVKRVKFKLADKRAALVDIGRMIGAFKEKEHAGTSVNVNVTTNVGVTVQMPDVNAPEFKALPAEERLRRLREAIEAVGKN